MDAELFNYMQERAKNIKKYSDKLTEGLKEIDGIITELIENIKMSYKDEIPLLIRNGNDSIIKYYLKASYSSDDPSGLKIVKAICEYGGGTEYEYDWIFEASKELQRLAIKRLPDFMRIYAKKLEEKEEDCKECSDMAEKILNAIKPKPELKFRKSRYGSIIKD